MNDVCFKVVNINSEWRRLQVKGVVIVPVVVCSRKGAA